MTGGQAVAVFVALASAGCTGPARRPPGLPPSPDSVSMAQPGGDAHQPHAAALGRQVREPWGWRNDKDDQVHFPLPDWEHWKRVRLRFVDHLVAFKYGDDKHLISAGFVIETPPGERPTSARCMALFEEKALRKAHTYRVRHDSIVEHQRHWDKEPLVVHATDGEFTFLFSHYEFSLAWAAYPAYEDGCLIYGVAVQWEGHPELARQVRDRWVEEGFVGMRTFTKTRAFRHED